MQRILLNVTMVLTASLVLVGCGVSVESGSDNADIIITPQETVKYNIHRIDEYGYVEEQLSSGCIYLTPGEEKTVIVEDEEIFAEYQFQYRMRSDHLLVSIKEDGTSLHRSTHRSTLFKNGYTVEQKVVTGLGISYLMTLEDTGCF